MKLSPNPGVQLVFSHPRADTRMLNKVAIPEVILWNIPWGAWDVHGRIPYGTLPCLVGCMGISHADPSKQGNVPYGPIP